mgnify:CR=1 FL=1
MNTEQQQNGSGAQMRDGRSGKLLRYVKARPITTAVVVLATFGATGWVPRSPLHHCDPSSD